MNEDPKTTKKKPVAKKTPAAAVKKERTKASISNPIKIEVAEITPAQEERIPEIRAKWMNIALSTTPADRDKAQEAVAGMYELLDLAPPQYYFWGSSPCDIVAQDAFMVYMMESETKEYEKWTIEQVLEMCKEAGQYIVDLFMDVKNVREPRPYVKEIMKTHANLDRSLSQASVSAFYMAGWLAHFDFYYQIGYDQLDALEPLFDMAKYAGWYIPRNDYCFIANKPTHVELDEFERPHSATGPHLSYEDGFEIYSWHGVALPDKRIILSPHELTVKDVDNEQNIEVRRVMIERMGPQKYLSESGCQKVHEDKVEFMPGKHMPRVLFRDKNNQQYLLGTDGSTDRVYFMSVPDTVRTCSEAHEAICGMREADCVAQS